MKQQQSKLDVHAERLDEWLGIEKKTFAEVQEQLLQDGCVVSLASLSRWWSKREAERLRSQLIIGIQTGARQVKEVDEAFKTNPAPEFETLIKLLQVVILRLHTEAASDPKKESGMLSMANAMTAQVLDALSAKTKAALEREKLSLARDKFELLASEKLLDQALRQKADEINSSNLSHAEKIAAMRREAFRSVDELQKSGTVVIPK